MVVIWPQTSGTMGLLIQGQKDGYSPSSVSKSKP